MTSTFGVIHRNNTDDKQLMRHGVESKSSPSSQISPTGSATDSNMNRITLEMVLSNGEALDLLMRHLEREYSMELLLSYIELDQFQKYVLRIADKFLRDNLLGISGSTGSLRSLGDAQSLPPATRSISSALPGGGSMTPKLEAIPESIPESFPEPRTPPMFVEFIPDQKEMEMKEQEPGLRQSDLQRIPNLQIDVMNTIEAVPVSEILLKMSSISTDRDISVDQKTMHDIKKKAHLLYNKYIKVGSQFEVNVGYGIRRELMNKLEDKDKLMKDEDLRLADLIQIFDEVKQTMKRLLQPSFGRMKSGPDCAILMMLFGSKTNQPILGGATIVAMH